MATPAELKQGIESKVKEIRECVGRIDEGRSLRTPAPGEWCVKEVLTHLGFDATVLESFRRIVQEDTPLIDVVPGQSHFDETHRTRPVGNLLEEVESRYLDLARFVGSLSDEQLQRRGHVPLFKQTPFGEYPTLEQWANGLINFHLASHVGQLQNLCQ